MTEIRDRRSWVHRLAASGAVGLDRTAGPRALVEDAVARIARAVADRVQV